MSVNAALELPKAANKKLVHVCTAKTCRSDEITIEVLYTGSGSSSRVQDDTLNFVRADNV